MCGTGRGERDQRHEGDRRSNRSLLNHHSIISFGGLAVTRCPKEASRCLLVITLGAITGPTPGRPQSQAGEPATGSCSGVSTPLVQNAPVHFAPVVSWANAPRQSLPECGARPVRGTLGRDPSASGHAAGASVRSEPGASGSSRVTPGWLVSSRSLPKARAPGAKNGKGPEPLASGPFDSSAVMLARGL